MSFTVYIPPHAETRPVPAIYYLSGLTCTDDNFTQKAGAQRIAAARGVILVAPDTSPRGANIDGEDDSWDFGTGAGFYVDATREPWSKNYKMYSYVTQELPALVEANFPVVKGLASVFGHSMGGHGALTIAFREPGRYKSVSAFSPICNPTDCPWGHKAFGGYFGEDRSKWEEHDATMLMRKRGPFPDLGTVLIDQGTKDNFLAEQLKPTALEAACKEKGQPVTLRLQEGYDHSYFFISTFMEDHINHHADALEKAAAAL